MILHVHSDAGYNNEHHARSRTGGHFFLGNKPGKPELQNGAILNPTHVLKLVATSAADAEIGAAFVNCKEAIPLRITTAEMGYIQPPTEVTLDNTTAVNFINQNLKQQRTKTIDMRYYYWLQDQQTEQHFKFTWKQSQYNKADYFTKHHPPSHHQEVRSHYVHSLQHMANVSDLPVHRPLRGCADPSCFQRPPASFRAAVCEPARRANGQTSRLTIYST